MKQIPVEEELKEICTLKYSNTFCERHKTR